jgi:hypothetical protein
MCWRPPATSIRIRAAIVRGRVGRVTLTASLQSETDRTQYDCRPSLDVGGSHLCRRNWYSGRRARNLSLEASGPHKMTATAQASGA